MSKTEALLSFICLCFGHLDIGYWSFSHIMVSASSEVAETIYCDYGNWSLKFGILVFISALIKKIATACFYLIIMVI
jgi:hypothetical protein